MYRKSDCRALAGMFEALAQRASDPWLHEAYIELSAGYAALARATENRGEGERRTDESTSRGTFRH
jgi:hypothetical protein